MKSPFVAEAIKACLGEAYLVGGAIRDYLLGVEHSGDYDFATPLLPKEVKKKLSEAGFKVIDYSEEFGTISTIISNTKIEITTFRKESYSTSSRNPDIKFSTSIVDDLSRRDFTINAIAYYNNEYIDPFGGKSDIENKIIRSVNDPEERFNEDPLRMLRALRFSSTLGFDIETKTYNAMLKYSKKISELSSERISAELDKLVVGENWIQALLLGLETRIFDHLIDTDFIKIHREDFYELIIENQFRFKSNGLTDRWSLLLFSIVELKTMNSDKARMGTLRKEFVNFKENLKWSRKFSETIYDKTSNEINKDFESNLTKELTKLKESDDSRQYIVEEKLLKLQLSNRFKEQNFSNLEKIVKRIIKLVQKNIEIQIKAGKNRNEVLRTTLPYMYKYIEYMFSINIISKGFIVDASELREVFEDQLKLKDTFDLIGYKISKQDKALIIERSIISLKRAFGDRFIGLSIAEIIESNPFIPLTKERLLFTKRYYLDELYALRRLKVKEGTQPRRALINKKIAELTFKTNDGKKDYSYLSHMVDYYKWSALSTEDKKKFWDYFEKMNSSMDAIDEIEEDLTQHGYTRSGQYLDTAQCLAHLLRLETNLDQKINITQNIIANYSLAGGYFKRNVPRYRLLRDWLVIVNDLERSSTVKPKEKNIEKRNIIDAANKILINLPKLKSYNYIDTDEEYISLHFPEINNIRTYIKEFENFLNAILKKDIVVNLKDRQLLATVTLYNSNLIDTSLALEVLNKVNLSKTNKGVNFDPINIINSTIDGGLDRDDSSSIREILDKLKLGENETVEFKESWRYDVMKKEVDKTGEIKKSALKCIAAFMNTNGGTLFIGVNDKGEITGLENTDFRLLKKKHLSILQLQDNIRKDIDNSLAASLGTVQSIAKIMYFETIEDKTIAVLSVEKSKDPIFFEDDIYIRSSASSRKLNSKDVFELLKSRV